MASTDHAAMASTDGLRQRLRPSARVSNGQHEPVDRPVPKCAPEVTAQPHFATLALPAQYDHLPLPTRLWLQSRYVQHKEYDFGPPGYQRPLTLANLLIAMDLVRIMAPPAARWITSRPLSALRMVWFFLARVFTGLAAAAKIWAHSQLLGLVEASLRGEAVDWRRAGEIGALTVGADLLPEVLNWLCHASSRKLEQELYDCVNKECLGIHLATTIPEMTDRLHGALVAEANLFGSGSHVSVLHSFTLLGSTLGTVTSLWSAVMMLMSVLGRGGSCFRPFNLLVIALALMPVMIDRVVQWHSQRKATTVNGVRMMGARMAYPSGAGREDGKMQRLATDFDTKKELILFGLRGWILARWAEARELHNSIANDPSREDRAVQLGANGVKGTIVVAFHLLLATQKGSSSLTLSTLNLYQSSVRNVVRYIMSLQHAFNSLAQAVFISAAYYAARAGQEPQAAKVDYETRRTADGGMRVEVRNLTFTYPGATSPALNDVSLTVEAGETLAIVGFNGGGKTTLVKVLLGLYTGHDGQEGEHLINGLPAAEYDLNTVYARTSCVFQDFVHYSLTLRENVGVGSVRHMEDDAALKRAIARGGGTGVLDKAGLDAPLRKGGSAEDTPANLAMAHLYKGDERKKGRWRAPEQEVQLSGGQWQRVALARAFLRADWADLVAFDEPTAALDPKAEAELFGRIHSLSSAAGESGSESSADAAQVGAGVTPNGGDLGGSERTSQTPRRTTTIYVSHRFSTVRRADKIAFVDAGRIAEYGTHAELMALQGRYHELFTLQRKGFDED